MSATDPAQMLEGLKTFLRIPSISTLSEHKPDIRRAAEFVRGELHSAGLAAELIEGSGNPLVYAEWRGAPGKPTDSLLRPLRRAAARSAGRMEIAAFRAGSPRRRSLRARRRRRQGPGLPADQSRGAPAEAAMASCPSM